ncbi:MAG: VWA domain-containing protein [Alphaproteobacteria bacterium]|nr:VWA domain-containing protein [Alphaproteobacteria bacterium]
MSGIISKFAHFLRSSGGNVATVFAIALMPISVMGGGAVDFAQAMNARGRLAEALDAAALAVGSQPNLSRGQAEQMALDYIEANYPAREIGSVHSISVSIDDDNGIVQISGQSRVETTLLGIMGMDYINVDWTSEVRRAQQNLELVMVLDNTGSMGGSKIRSLRDAAALLTDILFDGAQEPDDVRIGLVPFAATVNVGTQFERAWWLDPDAESPLHAQWAGGAQEIETCTESGGRGRGRGRGRGGRQTCTTETVVPNAWEFFDQLRNTSWAGCVEARAVPLDIEDVPPSRANPETLFLPFFAPDEPDNGNFYNSYLNDGIGNAGLFERLRNFIKYDNGRPSRGGPNDGCTTTPVTPMTNDRRTVENAISAMGASGNTNIPNGIGWGIRLISPQEPFTEGTAYDDRETIKAMVILTDGDNVLSGHNSALMSRYNAYGYIADGRLGIRTSSSNRLSDALDERTLAACQYARDQGIRIYTITFQVRNTATQNMMRDCASHPSLYFDSPSNEALEDAFEVIAGDLANLRISR